MSRRYRKSRREPGLLEIAATSDWKVGAGLAAVCAVTAAVIIPGTLGHSRVLAGLVFVFSPLAWLMAFVFAVIAFIRFTKQAGARKQSAGNTPVGKPSRASGPVISPGDKALLRRTFEPASNSPSAETSDTGVAQPRPTAWSLDVINRIEWKRFEDVCCAFYREKGIRAETTALGPDGGVDIRLFQDEANPTRITAVVQCKAWSQAVGVKLVRELRGVMAHEQAEKAFFMAPNGYTDDARAFAQANRITLLDGKLILAMLERLPEASRQRLLELATQGDWTTPTCPNCGAKMMKRESKRGRFWGCSTYPRCRAMLGMRGGG
ncbi:MAG: DUF2034 domain-containing protein [Azoarcus sp. PHD]|nr:MAG: DUF2034 domain-containing protein [Azoarcus sp. PHD]